MPNGSECGFCFNKLKVIYLVYIDYRISRYKIKFMLNLLLKRKVKHNLYDMQPKKQSVSTFCGKFLLVDQIMAN